MLPSDAGELYTQCTASYANICNDTVHFPTPTPAPAVMNPVLTNLGSCLKASLNGGPIEMEALRTSVHDVHTQWAQLVPYVQGVLRGMSVTQATPILANILMFLSKVGTRGPKPPIAAKDGVVSGTILAVALKIAGALTYTFELSLDQTNWTSTTTGKTTATLTGLIPGKTYWLRVHAFLRDGTTTTPVPAISFIAR